MLHSLDCWAVDCIWDPSMWMVSTMLGMCIVVCLTEEFGKIGGEWRVQNAIKILHVKMVSETSLRRVYIHCWGSRDLGIGHGWFFSVSWLVFTIWCVQCVGEWVSVQIYCWHCNICSSTSVHSPYSGQFTFSSLSLPFTSSFSSSGCQWRGALHHKISFLKSVFDGFVLFFCL